MKGIIPRKVLVGNKGISINIDRDTHRAIKAWAQGESITIAYAIRVMATAFFTSMFSKQEKEKKVHPLVWDKMLELVAVMLIILILLYRREGCARTCLLRLGLRVKSLRQS